MESLCRSSHCQVCIVQANSICNDQLNSILSLRCKSLTLAINLITLSSVFDTWLMGLLCNYPQICLHMSPDGSQKLVYAASSAPNNNRIVCDGVRYPINPILWLQVRGRGLRVERSPRRGMSSTDCRLGANLDRSERLFSNLLRISYPICQYRALSCARYA